MPISNLLVSVVPWALAMPVMIMFAILGIEVALGLRALPRAVLPVSNATVTVLIPAHNEAAGLQAMLDALAKRLPPNADVLVVADNCSDATAAIARDAGAKVVERWAPDRRGKGYALAFGREAMAVSPPGCVIVLDADCTPDEGALARLRDAVTAWNVPVQAVNLLRADLAATPMVQISNFAFRIKNLVRQRGAARIGSAATLTGTGMALPWAVFAEAPLASGDLVEDISLGIHAARSGTPPRLLPNAQVWSEAATEEATIVQRTRWEHGFLDTARRQALPAIAAGVRTRSWPLFWLGLHLIVPPLALLALLGLVVLALLGALATATGDIVPTATLGALIACDGLLLGAAWAVDGRTTLAARTVLRLPLYVLWKIPLYLKFGSSRETSWVRTPRADE